MEILRINGARPLHGALRVHGAKNSVLPILAAALLCPGTVTVHNCPRLSDVSASAAILRRLGCRVERTGDTLTVDASAPTGSDIPDALMREMRSSVIFLGAILARMGEADMSYPGGCELGPRPIDMHLHALRAMGAQVTERGGRLLCRAPCLTGCDLTLPLPSVGATENAMIAAVGARGTTTITNAAREPEIVDLQSFLCAMGARVRGAGTSVVTVEGGHPLHECEHTVIGDRIEAATYLAAAAAAGGEVEVRGADYRHLSTVTAALSEAGCEVHSAGESVTLRSPGRLHGIRPVHTAPYPGFPTDAQSPLMAAVCRGEGTSVFVEHVFSNRYRHVDELIRMGADIRVEGPVAVVSGRRALHGAPVKCTDLRGGAALVVAALSAEGTSEISLLRHIDRGYEDLAGDLRTLGAEITREENEEREEEGPWQQDAARADGAAAAGEEDASASSIVCSPLS